MTDRPSFTEQLDKLIEGEGDKMVAEFNERLYGKPKAKVNVIGIGQVIEGHRHEATLIIEDDLTRINNALRVKLVNGQITPAEEDTG